MEKLILGIDVETTGLLSARDKVIEVGAVLWSVHRKSPLKTYGSLVKLPDDIIVSSEITELTGITNDDAHSNIADPVNKVAEVISTMMDVADYCVAYNGSFDQDFLKSMFEAANLPFPNKHWIDARADIPFPSNIKAGKLGHLAADHGFVNPFKHRALFDVMTMMTIFSEYDFSEILTISQSPAVTVRAFVSFGEKDLAKKEGFWWNADIKAWVKEMKKCRYEELFTKWPFQSAIEEMKEWESVRDRPQGN